MYEEGCKLICQNDMYVDTYLLLRKMEREEKKNDEYTKDYL